MAPYFSAVKYRKRKKQTSQWSNSSCVLKMRTVCTLACKHGVYFLTLDQTIYLFIEWNSARLWTLSSAFSPQCFMVIASKLTQTCEHSVCYQGGNFCLEHFGFLFWHIDLPIFISSPCLCRSLNNPYWPIRDPASTRFAIKIHYYCNDATSF